MKALRANATAAGEHWQWPEEQADFSQEYKRWRRIIETGGSYSKEQDPFARWLLAEIVINDLHSLSDLRAWFAGPAIQELVRQVAALAAAARQAKTDYAAALHAFKAEPAEKVKFLADHPDFEALADDPQFWRKAVLQYGEGRSLGSEYHGYGIRSYSSLYTLIIGQFTLQEEGGGWCVDDGDAAADATFR